MNLSLDKLSRQGKYYLQGVWSIRVLFFNFLNKPVINVGNGSGTISADFYGDWTGKKLTTLPMGGGITLEQWRINNGVLFAYVNTLYDQSGNNLHATSSGANRPFINTTNFFIDASGGKYLNLQSGTVVGNGTYTFSSNCVTSANGIIIGANQNTLKVNPTNTGFINSWDTDFSIPASSGTRTITVVNYKTGNAPDQYNGVLFNRGNVNTFYTTTGYVDSSLISTSASRNGWLFSSGNETMSNGLQMYWCVISSQAVSNYDRTVIENIDSNNPDTRFIYTSDDSNSLYNMRFPFIFTPCGAIGTNGPNLTQMQSTYVYNWAQYTSNLNVTSTGIQLWKVPKSGLYEIICAGASGSNSGTFLGGKGIVVSNIFLLNIGVTLYILVGQTASQGGGGGTFVATENIPIIVAGGGGGANNTNNNIGVIGGNGGNGLITNDGGGEVPGTNGNGGGGWGSNSADGGGGAGFYGDGGSSVYPTTLSLSFLNGGLAGYGGGFGGGGSADTYWNLTQGGGGGGYSGGWCGGDINGTGGGGGGSYNGTLYHQKSYNDGDGYVIVNYVGQLNKTLTIFRT